MTTYSLFISTAKGLEYLLEDELKALGLHVTRVSPRGVYGEGDLALIYHLCLWSRLANRVYVILLEQEVHDQHMLYEICSTYPWENVFSVHHSFAIDFDGKSKDIRNTMFGAQVVKDGIVDYFQQQQGHRPSVDRESPHVRLHAYLSHGTVTIGFDVTGYSMHQRGYRLECGRAPLKETVAAAMLIRAQWPHLTEQGFTLFDPFCGSGTLVIEAAMMSAHMAPGLLREDQSVQHWKQHNPVLWRQARLRAEQAVRLDVTMLYGSDHNAVSIQQAVANAKRARLDGVVSFKTQELAHGSAQASQGLLICNPPYGERLGEINQLLPLYRALGQKVRTAFQGWQVALLTSNPLLSKATELRAAKQYSIYNGALACQLYCMTPASPLIHHHTDHAHILPSPEAISVSDIPPLAAKADMFANRLQKNKMHLQKWAKRNHVQAYRVYDRDLPEYAFAIDIYNDYAVLQEYKAPATIAMHKSQARILDVMKVVPRVLGIPDAHIVLKQREKQKGASQYQRLDGKSRTMAIREGQALLQVNLYDYLDTGVFLDHRPLRLLFEQLTPGVRFLNCFCYTATASVHAALAGAQTTNVDLSNTYLTWAEDNFKLNHIDVSRHQFIQYDCLQWLQDTRDTFDVIFLDPPSFSNSKRMKTTLDIQRDHVFLIQAAMRLLNQQGVLYFSTNLRQFQLSDTLLQEYDVKDITSKTIDEDFKRTPHIHRCFTIRK